VVGSAVSPSGAVEYAVVAESVADTVTVTMLSVPMATVGVTIPFVGEGDVVVAVVLLVAVLDMVIGMELGATIDDVVDSVVTSGVESDELEDVEGKI
jgi:hypothetical protein